MLTFDVLWALTHEDLLVIFWSLLARLETSCGIDLHAMSKSVQTLYCFSGLLMILVELFRASAVLLAGFSQGSREDPNLKS